MSSIASESCGDDLESYASSNGGYNYDSDGGYGGDDMTYDHDRYGSEEYISGGEYETSGSHGPYKEEDKGVEEFYEESYGEDEDSHTTHHGHGSDLRYIPSSHLCYEPIGEDLHGLGSCDEYESYGHALCGEYTREDSGFEHDPCEESSSRHS
ncbi:uncharacterized protein LOC132619571 [Lycium barbarum]|uniref:uncharacterized protein LOC132619571 n=1 Tax=Lycium barbarum TaxID=112863 RepID=UPI00293E7D26|nr:uncharacterized protein LOC132619571 [Lycium barbarum]